MAKTIRNRINRDVLQTALANQTGTLQSQEVLATINAPEQAMSTAAEPEKTEAEAAPVAAGASPAPIAEPTASAQSASSELVAPTDSSEELAHRDSQPIPTRPRPGRPPKRVAVEPTVSSANTARFSTRIGNEHYEPLQNARALLRAKGIKVTVMDLIDLSLAYYLPLVMEKEDLITHRKKS